MNIKSWLWFCSTMILPKERWIYLGDINRCLKITYTSNWKHFKFINQSSHFIVYTIYLQLSNKRNWAERQLIFYKTFKVIQLLPLHSLKKLTSLFLNIKLILQLYFIMKIINLFRFSVRRCRYLLLNIQMRKCIIIKSCSSKTEK